MKTLRLTVWERLQLANVLNEQRGNLAQIRRYLRVLDAVELNEKERLKIDLQVVQRDGRPPQFQWREDADKFDIELEDADFDILAEVVRSYVQWPANRLIVTMLDKIEAAAAAT